MFCIFRQSVVAVVVLAGLSTQIMRPVAVGQSVVFDVPAILPAYLIEVETSATTDTVQMEVPVSLLQNDSKGIELEELLIAVYWSTDANLVCDFHPKTIVTSDIEGTVAVQHSTERNASAGVDANGKYANIVGITGKLQAGGTNRESQSFHRLPEQELLTASGFIKRGTGVYFKFRATTQTTLEGTHGVTISFKVPKSWRAGLLRIDCQLKGKRVGFTSFDSSEFTKNVEFISVVHLNEDVLAYELATNYVQIENRLLDLQRQQQIKKPNRLLGTLESMVDRSPKETDWYKRLVYNQSEQALRQMSGQLPKSVQRVADDFVAARNQLVRLHR